MRIIQPSVRDGRSQLMRCLQSFVVFELLKNSKQIYIHTPILQDTRVLMNKTGEFTPALPDASWRNLYLSQLLKLLADQESKIHIRYRDTLDALLYANLQHPNIQLSQNATIYPPGWITESYAIAGIMYFRPDDISFFENEITISTESYEVDKLLLTVRSTW